MFVDARKIPDNDVLDADVCVVGGGAAGIAIARELAAQQIGVCLLESGGLRMDRATQHLCDGDSVGLPYDLETTRSRFFGGSTNCWGGFCRPFEAYHFEARDWVPDSGWPFTREKLDPYYRRAHELCGLSLAEDAYDAEHQLRAIPGENLQPLPLTGDRLLTTVAQVNVERRRFGVAFREAISNDPNIITLLRGNAVALQQTHDGGRIEHIDVATLAGNRLKVRARIFVLACGAIENARLLLASNALEANGIGNRHDVVGRYFMEHPTQQVTQIEIPEQARPLYKAYVDRYAVLRLPMAAELNVAFPVQTAERLLDSAAHIEFLIAGEDSAAIETAKRVYRDFWRGALPARPLQQMATILGSPVSLAMFAWAMFSGSERFVRSRHVTVSIEQSPNRDSRVTLGQERDALGVPRVCIDWRLSELDRYALQRTGDIIDEELRRAGLITASRRMTQAEAEAAPPRWNWHQMGTTRMHVDPKRGVVDQNCRVHGIGNLFIAGSSVFPTAGNHTPTLTLVALAVRLADRIRHLLTRESIRVIPGAETGIGVPSMPTDAVDIAATSSIGTGAGAVGVGAGGVEAGLRPAS